MAEHRLIHAFFWLLMVIVVCIGGALFGLDINETVRVNGGELLSATPRFVARAPFEARVDTVLVTEGARVRRGALLMVLANDAVEAALSQSRAEDKALTEELSQVERQLGNASERVSTLDARIATTREQFRVERKITADGARALEEQHTMARQGDSLVHKQVERARELYSRGMLSPAEFDEAQRALLERRNATRALEMRYGEQAAMGDKLIVGSRASQLQLRTDRLTMDATRLGLVERAQRLLRAIEKQRDEVKLREQAAAREQVRAEIDGTVRYVYNTKSARDFLDVGEVLVEVSPLDSASSALYARVKVDQQAVKQLRSGLRANLRLDAYQFYKYGGLRGTVRYVSPPNDDNEFFAVVDLERRADLQLRPGYRVSGGIVLGRLKLYEYILKKLFLGMEASPDAQRDSARVPRGGE